MMSRLGDLAEFRVNPEISFDSIEINILPDKVVICIFVEPYTVIEIYNTKFVDAYRTHFYTLWNQEVKTYVGWEQVEDLFLNPLFLEALPRGFHEGRV